MAETNPRYRRPLNDKQLDILHLLYRFRFITSDLLLTPLNLKDKSRVNERLKVLMEQKYIGRKYEPHYSLIGKHAAYYLLPDGIKALKKMREEKEYVASVFTNLGRDLNASDKFAEHSLDVLRVCNQLEAIYGDDLTFFSKTELAAHGHYFPKPLPDAYIQLQSEDEEVKQYFIEIVHASKPIFTVIKRVKQYVEYSDEGEWEDTKTPLPPVLFVCDTPTLQKRLQKIVPAATDDADIEELKIYTTSIEKLNSVGKPDNDTIWSDAIEHEGEFSLRDM